MDQVQGLCFAVWIRQTWNSLRQEGRAKILTNIGGPDPLFYKDPSIMVSGLIHMKDRLEVKGGQLLAPLISTVFKAYAAYVSIYYITPRVQRIQ